MAFEEAEGDIRSALADMLERAALGSGGAMLDLVVESALVPMLNRVAGFAFLKVNLL
jgi:hypothetical protein